MSSIEIGAPQSHSLNAANRRLLVISSLFPPDIMGGAEVSAENLAQWMRQNGFEVGVLTTAKSREDVCEGKEENGLKIWRVLMPRSYSFFNYLKATKWQKPVWHFQDHFDPRNRTIIARVLDTFKPTIVNVHILQGIGYNSLIEIAERRISTVYFLHDLGLACVRMAMFKNGRECKRQCTLCRLSSSYKASIIARIPRLGFCSPSRANLKKLSIYFPTSSRPTATIMNANKYPIATVDRKESEHLRILYVGRIHSTKGVHLLLEAAALLADKANFTVTVVGSGPDEVSLKKKYGSSAWCRFTGFVTQIEISNIMTNSDVMCVPSIWLENSPGVIIHALGLGLPVIGSDKGGIPELIEHGKNGLLFQPGDVVALRKSLEQIMERPELLKEWRDYARAHADRFSPSHLGKEILKFIESILEPYP